jgi:hypothetical protein
MVHKIDRIQKDLTLSIFLSFLSGIFIISGSIVLFMTILWQGTTPIIGGPWQMFSIPDPYWLTILMATVSASSGGLILFASYRMHKRSGSEYLGVFVILGSLIALFYAGMFGLAGILGLVGGATSLGVKSEHKAIRKNIHVNDHN